MEKVAVYASFKDQSKNSRSFVLKQLAEWCLLKNYDYTLYIDKVKNRIDVTNRKELKDLKDDIEQNIYSKVIVKDMSQLSRDTAFNLEFVNFLEENNCKIESIDGFDLHLYKNIVERFNKNKEEKER